MGIGASVGKNLRSNSGTLQHDHNDANRTPQDDAMSYKGKVGALRMIINSDGSKSALLKYLHEKGMDSILAWYFDMDEFKRTKRENLLSKAIEIRHRYDPKSYKGQPNPIMTEVWNSVNETLPLHTNDTTFDEVEIFKNLKIAQDYVFSILAKDLDSFLQSSWYTEFENVQRELTIGGGGGGKNTSVIASGNSASAFSGMKNHKATVELSQHCKSTNQNVLVVDDSPASCKTIAMILEFNGHRVRQANHGRIALEIITNSMFGFVLIDMSLKTMDPFEVAKRIKLWEHENVLNKMSLSGRNIGSNSISTSGSRSSSRNPLRRLSDPSIMVSVSTTANGTGTSGDSPPPNLESKPRLSLKRMNSVHMNIPVVIIGLLMHNQHIKENTEESKDFDYFLAFHHSASTGGVDAFSIDQLCEVLKAHENILSSAMDITPVVNMPFHDIIEK